MRCSPEMGRPKYVMMQRLGVPPQIAKSCPCLPPFPSFTFGSSFVSEGMHRSRKKVQCFAVLAILSVCVQVGANFLEARGDIGLSDEAMHDSGLPSPSSSLEAESTSRLAKLFSTACTSISISSSNTAGSSSTLSHVVIAPRSSAAVSCGCFSTHKLSVKTLFLKMVVSFFTAGSVLNFGVKAGRTVVQSVANCFAVVSSVFIPDKMDAAAGLGRNPVSEHHIQPEYGDEQADAGRDRRTRLARPNS